MVNGRLKSVAIGLAKISALVLFVYFIFGLSGQNFILLLFYIPWMIWADQKVPLGHLNKDIYIEAAETIEQFMDKKCSIRAWNKLLNRGMNGDARFMELQRVLAEIPTHYPPTETENYCSPAGFEQMLKIAEVIKEDGWNIENLKKESR